MAASSVMDEGAADLSKCQFAVWSAALGRSVCVPAVCIPLPAEFVAFLLADGVFLGENNQAIPAARAHAHDSDEDGYQRQWPAEVEQTSSAASSQPGAGDSGSDSGWGSEDRDGDWFAKFPQLRDQIQRAIEELGGCVMPKTNWSAPVDATWMNATGTMECTNAEEVALLLKSSDRIAHDLSEAGPAVQRARASRAEAAADAGSPLLPPFAPTLVLKRWVEMRPDAEFRCFVRGGALVGASQRHAHSAMPQLESSREEVAGALRTFHTTHVAGRLPLADCTYDVHLTGSAARGARVLDVNPWRCTTNPLLFTWEELEGVPVPTPKDGDAGDAGVAAASERGSVGAGFVAEAFELRVNADGACLVQPGARAVYGMPHDFVKEAVVAGLAASMSGLGQGG